MRAKYINAFVVTRPIYQDHLTYIFNQIIRFIFIFEKNNNNTFCCISKKNHKKINKAQGMEDAGK